MRNRGFLAFAMICRFVACELPHANTVHAATDRYRARAAWARLATCVVGGILSSSFCGPVWAAAYGTIEFHGRSVQLEYAYAFSHPSLDDRSKQTITFALSEKPFDIAKLDNSPTRESELDRQ